MTSALPSFAGEFSLVPVEERLAWRDALARHLLNQMRAKNGGPLPHWKVEEQIVPTNLAVAALIERGVVEPRAIEEQLCSDGANRNDYASSK